MHYIPEDGVYVYFRYTEEQTVMCIMNPEEKAKTLNGKRFYERTSGFNKGKDVISGGLVNIEAIQVPAQTLMVLELQ